MRSASIILLKTLVPLVAMFLTLPNIYSQEETIKFEDSIINEYQANGPSLKIGIDVLVYIHYQSVEESKRPDCALFYFTEEGRYDVKTSHLWQVENSSDIVLNTLPQYAHCELKQELKLRELNLNRLKKMLLDNSEKNQANFVYFNTVDSIGYFRTYILFPHQAK